MDGLEDYVDYEDYTPDNGTVQETFSGATGTFGDTWVWKYTHLTITIIISLVGLVGNALIIWISGWKIKRTVNTTFYLSLAVSDFLFCACMPMEIAYVMTLNWPFGTVLCKLVSSALFINMFGSVFVLVLISINRCVIAIFPVWSKNHSTIKMASGLLVLTWILSATLTMPSMLYRNTRVHGNVTQCYVHYGSISVHKAVVLSRFIGGFVIPFVIIISCCFILCVKLRQLTFKSTKPYKVMVALILSFFVCWIPYHIFAFLELNIHFHSLNVVQTGMVVGVTLAAANSVINPFLYVYIGKDFKQTLRKSIMLRMEYAMGEDGRTAYSTQGSVCNDQNSPVFIHNVL